MFHTKLHRNWIINEEGDAGGKGEYEPISTANFPDKIGSGGAKKNYFFRKFKLFLKNKYFQSSLIVLEPAHKIKNH